MKPTIVAFAVAILSALLSTPSYAIVISTQGDPNVLAATVSGGSAGLVVTGATLSGQATNGSVSSGTYTNAAGTYNNVGAGIVLSSGNVADYNTGPNTVPNKTTSFGIFGGIDATAAQELLLDPITGGSLNHKDVTQLDITFTSTTGEVFFNVVFGSEEFAEFINTIFIDAFGIYLNGTNIAFLSGAPININHPSMEFLGGTELDGILTPPPGDGGNPIVTFAGTANTGIGTTNTLTFIVADSGDSAYDTTVFISSLGGVAPEPPENGVPEPGTLLLLGAALAGLAGMRRRRY